MRGFRIFSFGDIPVSLSPWYLLIILWWMRDGWASGLVWAGVVTVSILVHELGHALVARHYGLAPSILLHGLGGLCAHDRAERDRHDAFIIAAGPAAGLLLGGLTVGVFFLLGGQFTGRGGAVFGQIVTMSLYVNFIWSFVNLLPLWPLDGGQLFRLGLIQFLSPKLADGITHVVSLALIAVALSFALMWSSTLLGILCAFGLYMNVRALRGDISSGAYRPTNRRARGMLDAAKKEFAEESWREAARLCHRLRSEKNVPDKVTREMWAILGVSEARLGDHRGALHFLQKAPERGDVTEAKIECFFALGHDDDLEAVLASRAFQKLPKARREEILTVIRAESTAS